MFFNRNKGFHWKYLYNENRAFYDLAWWRAGEFYPEYDDPEDAPAEIECVFGSRCSSLTLRVVDAEAESLYAWGYCTLLALAIHERTGFPIALFTTANPEPGEWSGHAAIQVADGLFLDITGIHTATEITQTYRMENVEPHIVSKEEFCNIVASDEHIQNPMSFVDELEQLITYDFAEYLIKVHNIQKR